MKKFVTLALIALIAITVFGSSQAQATGRNFVVVGNQAFVTGGGGFVRAPVVVRGNRSFVVGNAVVPSSTFFFSNGNVNRFRSRSVFVPNNNVRFVGVNRGFNRGFVNVNVGRGFNRGFVNVGVGRGFNNNVLFLNNNRGFGRTTVIRRGLFGRTVIRSFR